MIVIIRKLVGKWKCLLEIKFYDHFVTSVIYRVGNKDATDKKSFIAKLKI